MSSIARTSIAIALLAAPIALGCSHDDGHQDHDGSMARTSGDEGRADSTYGDGHASGTTATDQGESASDVEITRQIRSAVVADSSLSVGARNCVIITNGGHVTLRGDATSAERAAIERHAVQVTGVVEVENDIRATDQAAAP